MGEDRAEFLLARYEELGVMSPMLENTPAIFSHLTVVWDVYQLLRNSRSIGFGTIWFIPLSEIVCALDMYEVQSNEWRIYYSLLIQNLDQTYVKWWSDKNEAQSKAASSTR